MECFEDATTVFNYPFAYIFDDEWHSVDEPREIIIGHDQKTVFCLSALRALISAIPKAQR
ncbi:hypothetical protein [Fischerella sp. PCC 9605]|uniref:hypothetical protein n=1 Tax=Fischerella sp. PCC 9605 TaxID=1173024 RepID=UPI0004AEEB86|nr:hypothetical protein [Fischerella sp. PCC 9605]